jgi:hypothetical protein
MSPPRKPPVDLGTANGFAVIHKKYRPVLKER